MELPLDLLDAYDKAAEHCAVNGLAASIEIAFRWPQVAPYIISDPEAFEERVRAIQYAHAMEKTEEK